MNFFHEPDSSKAGHFLFGTFLLCLLVGCRSEAPSHSDVKTVELEAYETVVAYEDDLLAIPTVIRHDGHSTLFVYDAGNHNIVAIDRSGSIVQEYGAYGEGPGEFVRVNNIFPVEDHLYVVDYLQTRIHKYHREGELLSSLNYGALGYTPAVPPAPFGSMTLRAENLNHQPVVALDDQVLLSPLYAGESPESVYRLLDWEGNHLSEIGEIPSGSAFHLDYDQLRADVVSREVPAFYRSNAFAVVDQANPNEYFLIYTAIPKVAKYNAAGQRLWVNEAIHTPAIDSIANHFYETMDRMQQDDRRSRITLEYYVSGTSTPEGDLYLAASSDPVSIHQFSKSGELIREYELISQDVDLLPIFDIDAAGGHLFVVTEEAEIRAYSLE